MPYLNAQIPVVDKQGVVTLAFLRFLNALAPMVPTTVDRLPTAAVIGQLASVTDSTTNTWGATATGGGALVALVWWNGANWTVIGH